MSKKIKTRFLLLSDTHGRPPHPPTATSLPYRWPLPQADVAIHTGDLTLTGKLAEHQQALELLQNLQADLKIVIPGNHDLTLDTTYYAEKGDLYGPRPKYTKEQLQSIRDLYTGSAAHAANIMYLEEGTQTFKLKNGARLTVYASAYTPEFCDWAFAYPREEDRFNLHTAHNPVPDFASSTSTSTSKNSHIDVMLTHGPPFGVLDRVINKHAEGGEMHVGCEHLLRATGRARPLLHCFGHIHEGWGAERRTWSDDSSEKSSSYEKIPVDSETAATYMAVYVDYTGVENGKETLFVNSSIMDVNYNAVQGPWLIDLSLEAS